jgi:hypothetical protein
MNPGTFMIHDLTPCAGAPPRVLAGLKACATYHHCERRRGNGVHPFCIQLDIGSAHVVSTCSVETSSTVNTEESA